MKIKISKSQWEGIGKKAGWMKTAAPDNSIVDGEESEVVDLSSVFPNAIAAEAKDKNVLIMEKLSEPYRRFDGKMANYQLQYRWLSKSVQNDRDGNWRNVMGSENTYYTEKELQDILPRLRQGISLFDNFNLF
jgi:hypothetical protein